MNTVEPKKDKREWHNCGKQGHTSANRRSTKKKSFEFGRKDKKYEKKEDAKDTFALNVCSFGDDKNSRCDAWPPKFEWILDSGCGRHLTGCSDLLGENADEAGTSLVLPDGTKTKSLRKGSIEMTTQVGEKTLHLRGIRARFQAQLVVIGSFGEKGDMLLFHR